MDATPSNATVQLPASETPHHGELDANTPGSWAHHSTSWTPVDSMTPLTTNPSRKRSRDESAFAADGESSYFSFPSSATASQNVSTPAPIPEEPDGTVEPIMGEGMVLIDARTGVPLAAESQTGTWYEEKLAQEQERRQMAAEMAAEQAERQFRPQLPVGRKSIRMSQSSIRAEVPSAPATATIETPISANGLHQAPASPPKSSPGESGDRPEVDEATIALGIGWTKMASEDVDLQAAARGWARYIENHYRDLHDVEILLKSRSLNAYLVRCSDGFYLFNDNLLEGRRVSRTWDGCLANLKAVPITFDTADEDGGAVLHAERTPGPDFGQIKREVINNWADYDRINNRPIAAGGMDLD